MASKQLKKKPHLSQDPFQSSSEEPTRHVSKRRRSTRTQLASSASDPVISTSKKTHPKYGSKRKSKGTKRKPKPVAEAEADESGSETNENLGKIPSSLSMIENVKEENTDAQPETADTEPKKPATEKETKYDPNNTLVVGIVHAHWCIHCTNVMGPPEEQPFPNKPSIWKDAKKEIDKKKTDSVVTVFIDIESENIDNIKTMVNDKFSVKLESKAYPTLFKIWNGELDQDFKGERTVQGITSWALTGVPAQKGGRLTKKKNCGCKSKKWNVIATLKKWFS
jgi:thiol-disulfide isomerase/thioredoxin